MIKFKTLTQTAQIPKRATEGSAGFDLHYDGDSCVLAEGEHAIFKTGIAMRIEPKQVGIIKPRSGWAYKYGVDVLAGVIDSDYRGELQVILINHGNRPLRIMSGDRIAQLVVTNYEPQAKTVSALDDTGRGSGGFGSTGVN
jgi:dUTP pyrophosphatase